MKNIQLGRWNVAADYFYDFAAVGISTSDIVTDLLVVREFYLAEKWAVAYVATIILVCAQIFYLMFFYGIYIDDSEKLNGKHCKQTIIILLMLPFGQLVPLFMWIEAHRFGWLLKVMEYIGLMVRDRPEAYGEGDDLLVWIQNTFRKHGGFVIEAFLEALPQSILQMVAILYYQEATTLSICSIILSMTSVASKGIIMSYSMNWHSFVFNSVCFAADIFGIFASLSWVFYKNNQDDGSTSLVNEDTFAQIWFYQLVLLFGSLFLVAGLVIFTKAMWLLFACCLARDHNNQRYCSLVNWQRCLTRSRRNCLPCLRNFGDCCVHFRRQKCFDLASTCNTLGFIFFIWPSSIVAFLVSSLTIVAITLMIIQIFKIFPIRLTASEGSLADDITFYVPWFSFLLEGRNFEDRDLRFAVSYKTLATNGHYDFPYGDIIKKKPYEALKPGNIRLAILGRKPRLREWLLNFPRRVVKKTFLPGNEKIWTSCDKFLYIWILSSFYFSFTLLVPVALFSTVYNMVYPIIALGINGFHNQVLSVVLTIIYMFFFIAILLLAPETYRYRTMLYYATMIAPIVNTPNADTAKLIKKRYYGKLYVHSTEVVVRSFFGEIANVVLMYLGEDSECSSYEPKSRAMAKKLCWSTREGAYINKISSSYIYDFAKHQPVDHPIPLDLGVGMPEEPQLIEEKLVEVKETHLVGHLQAITQSIDEVGVLGTVRDTSALIYKKYGVPMPSGFEYDVDNVPLLSLSADVSNSVAADL